LGRNFDLGTSQYLYIIGPGVIITLALSVNGRVIRTTVAKSDLYISYHQSNKTTLLFAYHHCHCISAATVRILYFAQRRRPAWCTCLAFQCNRMSYLAL